MNSVLVIAMVNQPPQRYSTGFLELVKNNRSHTNSPVHQPEERCNEDYLVSGSHTPCVLYAPTIRPPRGLLDGLWTLYGLTPPGNHSISCSNNF